MKKNAKQQGLFILPAAVMILAVTVFPLVYSLRVVVTDYNLLVMRPPNFIGIGNFIELFGNPSFWNCLVITFEITVPSLLIEVLFGVCIALLLNSLHHRNLFTSLLRTAHNDIASGCWHDFPARV